VEYTFNSAASSVITFDSATLTLKFYYKDNLLVSGDTEKVYNVQINGSTGIISSIGT